MSVNIRITEVTVCALPEDNINHSAYAVTVQWRGGETYAVMHRGFALDDVGNWEYEPSPSGRTDGWIATHRFGYDEAYRRAVEVAPRIVVNGRSAGDLARDIPTSTPARTPAMTGSGAVEADPGQGPGGRRSVRRAGDRTNERSASS